MALKTDDPIEEFKKEVFKLLEEYEFRLIKSNGKIIVKPPKKIDRNFIRKIHEKSLDVMYSKIKKKDLEILMNYIAEPTEINADAIDPKIIDVSERKEFRAVFRAAKLFWKVPLTNGFGRRINLLIIDRNNEKLIGIMGLCDPVFNLKARDEWIGWDVEIKKQKLWHVMNAYVLGAVPPYNSILGGKLVSLLALSRDVREIFKAKYKNRKSEILGIKRPPHLVLITTTTAYGKSIMLDRLHNDGHYYWKLIGFTSGYAPIVFDGNIYKLAKKVLEYCNDKEHKKFKYGNGPNFKLRVLRRALWNVGLDSKIINIGLRRGIYIAKLAENTRDYLLGKAKRPRFFKNYSTKKLLQYFKERWLLPRYNRLKKNIEISYEMAIKKIEKFLN